VVLPIGNISLAEEVEVVDVATLPTKTYKLDFEKGRCVGMIDGKKAMEQAIFKALNTARFAHTIYSDDYGFEQLIGKEEIFVRAELPRRIKEALLQDERITSIENLKLDFKSDEAYASFTAVTIYGDVNVLREVIEIV
jgi:hypothetical protein